MFDYRKSLAQQKINSRRDPNLTYLSWLYGIIQTELNSNQNILEIGAGAGISEDFLKNMDILKTDILSWEDNSVIGNIDAEKLPFNNGQFSNIIAIDVIHHTNSPNRVINECLRVLAPGGKLIIVEPYVSVFSYVIYKMFHHENTSWKIKIESPSRRVNEAFDGDQGVSRVLFKNKKQIDKLKNTIDFEFNIEKRFISFLSFFATGGLSRPLPTNKFLISALIRIENRFPQYIFKICASRIFVVIKKTKDQLDEQ